MMNKDAKEMADEEVMTVYLLKKRYNPSMATFEVIPPKIESFRQEENIINCSGLGLTELPPLPPHLKVLSCSDNCLESLPPLPNTLERLHCERNNLKALPLDLPQALELHCQGNPLTQHPRSKEEVFWYQTFQSHWPLIVQGCLQERYNHDYISLLKRLIESRLYDDDHVE